MTDPELDALEDDYGSHRGVPGGPIMDIVYVCVLGASVAGLYFGMRYGAGTAGVELPESRVEAERTIPAGTVPATAYADIVSGNLGPNANLRTQLIPRAAQGFAERLPTDPFVVPGDLNTKRADLAARAERRAFNGAPPTIPHRIDPRDATSCSACHGAEGMQLGDVIAKPMPHENYANCTQCHVPQKELEPSEARWLENDFVGLPAPTAGERSYSGAPPVVPHATHMRENCATCHGWSGDEGLKSSHPWRSSCLQCHAPWAARDAQPGADWSAPLFLPGPNEPATGDRP